MPVQWLYVLQNGAITAPAGSDGSVAHWKNITDPNSPVKPSRDNPIVGRVAFWTDDETSKLNVNTASEGTFWDRSIGTTQGASPYSEQKLQNNMPIKGEYQRYPGHPAMTSLSPVLAGLIPSFGVPLSDTVSSGDYGNKLKRYYDLVPRVGEGGSQAGTRDTYTEKNKAILENYKIALDQDRLYSSIDELMFRPNETPRVVNPDVTKQVLERAKFFLTAYNRAPEVNVFSQPRISLWNLQQENEPNKGKPNASGVNAPASARNIKDKVLAFCATIGRESKSPNAKPAFYAFQRHSIYLREAVNDRSSHKDIPFKQLPEYGFAPPSSQHPHLDWTANDPAMQRNQKLYTYLQNLTDMKIPGWGKSFTSKYSKADRDQILTQMVDQLRTGTNSYARDPQLLPRYEYAPARGMPDASSGETQLVPLVPPNGTPGEGTKGFGRFPSVTEMALLFYRSGPNTPAKDGKPEMRKMRILVILEPYTPTAGSWTWSPLVRYVVKGLNKIKINGEDKLFPLDKKTGDVYPGISNLVTSRCGYGSGGNHNTAFTGTWASFRAWNGPGSDKNKKIPAPGATEYKEEDDYALVSKEIEIPVPAPGQKDTFEFDVVGDENSKSLEFVVEVHAGFALGFGAGSESASSATRTLVQTHKFLFARTGESSSPSKAYVWPVPDDAGGNLRDINGRFGVNDDGTWLVKAADTVRSMQVDPSGPTKGDLAGSPDGGMFPQIIIGAESITGATVSKQARRSIDPTHSLRNGDGKHL
jgi:uncharacterized protein (TIGR02600 family)